MASAEPASASFPVPCADQTNENENEKREKEKEREKEREKEKEKEKTGKYEQYENEKQHSKTKIKGRLQPPERNGLALSYVQIPKSKVLVDRHGGLQDVPIVEFCSTALPQPFVNPETRRIPPSSPT